MSKIQRRAQLLRVAKEIISKEGASRLTMARLAERSGITKPVVYEHFANRSDLAVAVIDAYFADASDFTIERVKHAEDIGQYMTIIIDAMFDFHAREQMDLRSILGGFATDSAVREAYARYHQTSTRALDKLLQQQGVPRNVSSVAAYTFIEMVSSTVHEFAGRTRSPIAREALKRMAVGAVQGLSPQSQTRPEAPIDIIKVRPRRRKSPQSA